jgi:hypothetical protein
MQQQALWKEKRDAAMTNVLQVCVRVIQIENELDRPISWNDSDQSAFQRTKGMLT